MTKNKQTNLIYYLGAVLLAAVLVFLDQFTKHLAVIHLKGKEAFVLIQGVFEFSYLENRGAAFGIFENMQWLFILATLVILAVALIIFIKLPKTSHFLPLLITMAVVVAGAIGNLADRILHGYVIDFLYFSLIDFPIFNVADVYIVMGCLLFVIFYVGYSDSDFAYLKKN